MAKTKKTKPKLYLNLPKNFRVISCLFVAKPNLKLKTAKISTS
jgi:hypothetical protein